MCLGKGRESTCVCTKGTLGFFLTFIGHWFHRFPSHVMFLHVSSCPLLLCWATGDSHGRKLGKRPPWHHETLPSVNFKIKKPIRLESNIFDANADESLASLAGIQTSRRQQRRPAFVFCFTHKCTWQPDNFSGSRVSAMTLFTKPYYPNHSQSTLNCLTSIAAHQSSTKQKKRSKSLNQYLPYQFYQMHYLKFCQKDQNLKIASPDGLWWLTNTTRIVIFCMMAESIVQHKSACFHICS